MAILRLAATALLVTAIATAGAVPAHAAPASPAAISVDCGTSGGVTDTTITGRVGDTLTVQNTSGTCTFASYSGIVTATRLNGSDQLVGFDTSTLTIVAPGTFAVTPSTGTAGTFTVVIGDPNPAPEYVITFDANGGDCSSNPLTITAAAGDWYAAPTDGTGPFQCHRDDYRLVGWSHGSTLALPGAAEQVPDVVLPKPDPATGTVPDVKHALAADHVTLYAVWVPDGVEITYDANVAADDTCIDGSGDNVPVAQRTTEKRVYYASSNHTVASSAPCSPVDGSGAPLPLKGWALSGDGDPAFVPGESIAKQRFRSSERPGLETGKTAKLYAVWGSDDNYGGGLRVIDDNFEIQYEVNTDDAAIEITFRLSNGHSGWMGLTFGEFMFPGDSIIVWMDESGIPQVWDAYNPGIPTLPTFPAPLEDINPVLVLPNGNPFDNVENVEVVSSSQVDGVTTITVRRALITQDIFDFQIYPNQTYHVVAAYNTTLPWNPSLDAQQPDHTSYGSMMWGF